MHFQMGIGRLSDVDFGSITQADRNITFPQDVTGQWESTFLRWVLRAALTALLEYRGMTVTLAARALFEDDADAAYFLQVLARGLSEAEVLKYTFDHDEIECAKHMRASELII
jgi:hypothetical protein